MSQQFTRLRTLSLTLLLSLSVGGLFACSQQQPQDNEIRIGVIASLSNDNAEYGKSTIEGAKLAVEEVNNAGGLDVGGQKKKITLVVEDDQSKPEVAVIAAQKLINQENVVAIIGPQVSRSAIPVATLVEDARIPMIAPTASNPEVTSGKKYAFRAIFIDPFQGKVMAHFAKEQLRARTAAVLYDVASDYNRGIAEVFKNEFEQTGGKVAAFESYTTGARDFSDQLTRIRDSKPDVLFLPNYYNEVPLQGQQAREEGIKATFLGSDTWGSLKPADRQPLEGAYYSTQYATDSQDEKNQEFIKLYNQTYKRTPTDVAATTYDSVGLFIKAIESQDRAEPESIRNGLSSIGRYTGVTGTIEYQNTGDPARSLVIVQLKEGKPVFYKQVNP